MVRFSHGAPGDVFSSPAPRVGGEPPQVRSIQAGDMSVASKTGAFEYSYPLTLPPGRLGMQPTLALSYSSQAQLYGGIAAGWSLGVPVIEVDPTQSVLDADQDGPAT